MKVSRTFVPFILVFSFFSFRASAQKPEIFSTEEGAIRGYDPVAFFTEKKPVAGKKEFTYQWKDATWHFSSEENLNLFKSSPEKFAPQFGGYCAYGTSQGHKSPTLPETWTIIDDRLYFNYNKDVQKKWNEKRTDYIRQAEKNWPELKKQ